MSHILSKWYTRVIGIFFILIIFSLGADYYQFGFRPETMHKVFHVVLGAFVVRFGWRNEMWWRVFPLANGMFFSYVAMFGFLFPNFGNLDAFNTVDTALHATVGISGLVVWLIGRNIFARQ